jgi:hypothetical protein
MCSILPAKWSAIITARLICSVYGLEGETQIITPGSAEPVVLLKGETVLIPAEIKEVQLLPTKGESKLIEVYIE